jgi:uncharacterized protein (TIRG00374 family)
MSAWSRPRRLRWLAWLIAPGVVAFVAYTNRDDLARAADLMGHASLAWMVPAACAIGGVYLCRAAVYATPLATLGFSFTRSFLWSTALVATSVHQLVPTGGASGYAFLTFALHRRGVPGGQASLIALIDTLSYAVAVATLVIASVIYLATGGVLDARRLPLAVGPGLLAVALAGWVYHVQGDRARFTRLAVRIKDRLAARLGREWSDGPIRRFLDEYYAGKAVIRRRPGVFFRMIGFQFLAVGCDATALYMAFLALGLTPKVWVVLTGFVVSMAALAIVGVPGGGGSFEVVMSMFFAHHGLAPAQGIAAAILYRVVAFWLPVLVSLVVLLRLRERRKEVWKTGGRRRRGG